MRNQEWKGTVERVRRAETARGRAQGGCFSIEGMRLHERAMRAGWQVETAVLSEAFSDDPSTRVQSLLHALKVSGCQLVEVPDEMMRDLTGGRDLGGIIGLIRRPEPLTLADILASAGGRAPLLLVAADVKDPGNVGALMRTALASGATGFVACGASDPYHPRALRTSMGSVFKLPVLTMANTVQLLSELTASGIQCIGLAVKGDVSLADADFYSKGTAVILGSEAHGLQQAELAGLDGTVSIPMRDGVDSYSVNAAAAIMLYEIGRRRAAGPGHEYE